MLRIPITPTLLVLMFWVFGRLPSSLGSSIGVRPTDSKPYPLAGVTPDPFVAAAPLIIAAVCSDGVILVAVHTTFANEPLLSDDTVSSSSSTSSTNNSTSLQDLPKSYRGPFRIYSIDGFGTGLICAGWRADGQILAEYCRSVASDELAVFGEPRQNDDYGNYLASETSLWMAQCAVSERVRALSCVGLLAASGGVKEPGFLWLVDATGSYRIRAHAVGGGSLAAKVNENLETMDSLSLSHEEALRNIIELLAGLEELPADSRVEIALVGCDDVGIKKKRRMKRLLSSRLFGVGQPRKNKST